MNDKRKDTRSKPPEKAKKTGFYAALFSCVGIMLALAVAIGYKNLFVPEPKPQSSPKIAGIMPSADPFIAPVGKNITNSYANQEEVYEKGEIGSAVSGESAQQKLASPSSGSENNVAVVTPAEVAAADLGTLPVIVNKPVSPYIPALDDVPPDVAAVNLSNDDPLIISPASDDGSEEAKKPADSGAPAPAATPNRVGPKPEPGAYNESKDDVSKEKNDDDNGEKSTKNENESNKNDYAKFAENERMSWPLTGDIIMDYSVDHVIYDKTLNQYRVNDKICIAATDGAEVKAAAEGVVKDIIVTRRDGKIVVIDHGNGWLTTYSQLGELVAVSAGDVVKKGELIGVVGTPSIYSVSLGNHLGFAVMRDDKAVDPKSILAEE